MPNLTAFAPLRRRRWVFAGAARFERNRFRVVSAAAIVVIGMQVAISWMNSAGTSAAVGIYDWRSLLLDGHIEHPIAVATIVVVMSPVGAIAIVLQQTNIFATSRMVIGAMAQIWIPVRKVRSFPEYLRRLRTVVLVGMVRILIGGIASAVFVMHVMSFRCRFGEIRWGRWLLQWMCTSAFAVALLPIAVQHSASIQTALSRHHFTRFQGMRFVGRIWWDATVCHGSRQRGKRILQRIWFALLFLGVAHPCEVVVAARRFIWDSIEESMLIQINIGESQWEFVIGTSAQLSVLRNYEREW